MTRPEVRPPAPVTRPPLLVQGLAPAAVAGLLLLGGLAGPELLAGAVLLVQVVLGAGVLVLLHAPDPGGTLIVTTAAGVASSLVVVAAEGRVEGLAGVVALALVGGLVHQLVRRPRDRVTESLAGTLFVVVLVACASSLVALRALPGGRDALAAALVAVAGALLAGRVGDALAPRPPLADGATRGWPGLLLGLLAGAAAGGALAAATQSVPAASGALLGLAVATAAVVADLAVDLAALEPVRRSGARGAHQRTARRSTALRRVALLLPYALAGPVALLAGRLVLA